MTTPTKLSSAIFLMAAPVIAYAEGGAPHIELYAFAGGAIGGLVGSLLACWLCKRIRGPKDTTDSKKY